MYLGHQDSWYDFLCRALGLHSTLPQLNNCDTVRRVRLHRRPWTSSPYPEPQPRASTTTLALEPPAWLLTSSRLDSRPWAQPRPSTSGVWGLRVEVDLICPATNDLIGRREPSTLTFDLTIELTSPATNDPVFFLTFWKIASLFEKTKKTELCSIIDLRPSALTFDPRPNRSSV